MERITRKHRSHNTIQQLFEAQVERTPEATAVLFGDKRLTYQELNARANQCAGYLSKRGVRPEMIVGIFVERSLEMMVGVLGILKAGGAYVPLDPSFPEDRLSYMMEDTQAPILLTQRSLVEKLPDSPRNDLEVICLDTDWAVIAQESQANRASGATEGNLACVIYTSGSTGKPKGVLIEHRVFCNMTSILKNLYDPGEKSRVLQLASLSSGNSMSEFLMALPWGATLCLETREAVMPGPSLIRVLRERAITHIHITPSALASLPVEHLPDLQILSVGGELCRSRLVEKWASGRRFFNVYGATETYWLSVGELKDSRPPLPVGRPFENMQAYIVDSNLQPAPAGEAGELYIGGVGLARGYLNRPDLTAERFIPNPFSEEPDARLYKTGDLARFLPDGQIEILGRADHQVKIRGFRVEPGEIEARLAEHPRIRETVVVARKNASGEDRLVAYIVPARQPPPTIPELRAFLAQKVPDYMMPGAFVTLEAMPLNPAGKVDRAALPAPGHARPELENTFVAPRTPVEQTLAEIWREMLRVDRVGIHDNFFELGGDSLLATQIVSRVIQRFQIEVPVKSIFDSSTVERMACVLAETGRDH